jgi:hypothetical protein
VNDGSGIEGAYDVPRGYRRLMMCLSGRGGWSRRQRLQNTAGHDHFTRHSGQAGRPETASGWADSLRCQQTVVTWIVGATGSLRTRESRGSRGPGRSRTADDVSQKGGIAKLKMEHAGGRPKERGARSKIQKAAQSQARCWNAGNGRLARRRVGRTPLKTFNAVAICGAVVRSHASRRDTS